MCMAPGRTMSWPRMPPHHVVHHPTSCLPPPVEMFGEPESVLPRACTCRGGGAARSNCVSMMEECGWSCEPSSPGWTRPSCCAARFCLVLPASCWRSGRQQPPCASSSTSSTSAAGAVRPGLLVVGHCPVSAAQACLPLQQTGQGWLCVHVPAQCYCSSRI